MIAREDVRVVDGDRTDDAADGSDDRQHRTAPGMQRSARQYRLNHFLGQEPKHDRHADIVHRKRKRLGELKIAGRIRICPDDGGCGTNWHDHVML